MGIKMSVSATLLVKEFRCFKISCCKCKPYLCLAHRENTLMKLKLARSQQRVLPKGAQHAPCTGLKTGKKGNQQFQLYICPCQAPNSEPQPGSDELLPCDQAHDEWQFGGFSFFPRRKWSLMRFRRELEVEKSIKCKEVNGGAVQIHPPTRYRNAVAAVKQSAVALWKPATSLFALVVATSLSGWWSSL